MSGPPRAKTGPTASRDLEMRRQILALRCSGATLEQIGQQVGRTKGAVQRSLKKCFAEYHEQLADMTRAAAAIELARLDRAQLGIWKNVTDGHLGAIDRFLGISKRRAELLGLDAPRKIASTDPSGDIAMPLSGPAQVVVYRIPDNGRDTNPDDPSAGARGEPNPETDPTQV